MSEAILSTNLRCAPKRSGKVRDIYDLGENLLIVATDRISAFDRVMPNGIPDKGKILTQMSVFWFDLLGRLTPHHMLSADVVDFGLRLSREERELLRGRSMLVRKAEVVPVECVARGYLAGSGWKEYCERRKVCGVDLPAGLVESARLPETIFTPATKAQTGHDENIPFQEVERLVGKALGRELRDKTVGLYESARGFAEERGILIADTKFEWGRFGGELMLIDEVLTPDSSRFWPTDGYRPGGPQPSFDKQFVRDYLLASGWDRESAPPELPPEVVAKTRAKYVEAYERVTGRRFEPRSRGGVEEGAG
ncbi:MAG: phosphoribosylaminoimidazolesuccinocarboxamide synthase [Planctomycetota bacterium]